MKDEADKQVAHLTSSLKQVQSQAAGISRERERLAAQVQQQAATPRAVPEVGPYPSSKQDAVTLQLSFQRTKGPYQSMRLLRSKPACGHTSLFKQKQLVILPYLPLHSLVAGCLHDAKTAKHCHSLQFLLSKNKPEVKVIKMHLDAVCVLEIRYFIFCG